jgi:integrase/recombinase XerD
MTTPIALDPEGFEHRLAQYREWLLVNHFSEATAEGKTKYLGYLVAWCQDRGLVRPSEVTKPILERYQAHLFHRRKVNGEPLSLATQQNHLTAAKSFFRWLSRQNLILYNPASEILLPRLGKRLPKHVLSIPEVERVLAVPDPKTPLGVRDRALLETCYSTGLRRMELVALKLYDLDRDRGVLHVREGKGRNQRVVPIGERALKWVEKYLSEVRPSLAVPPDEGFVFLTHRGGPFEIDSLTEMIRVFVDQAGIGKKGSVHLFRHSMATHMLEGGADVRYVQAMLGHAKLETTAIYTHVAIRKLKEIHTRTHPAAQLKHPGRKERAAPGKEDVKEPSAARGAAVPPPAPASPEGPQHPLAPPG